MGRDNEELERVGLTVEFEHSDDNEQWSVVVTFDEPTKDASTIITGWIAGIKHFCEDAGINLDEIYARAALAQPEHPLPAKGLLN